MRKTTLGKAIDKAIRIVRDTAIEDRPSLDDWFDVGEVYTVNVSGRDYVEDAPADGAWAGVYKYSPKGIGPCVSSAFIMQDGMLYWTPVNQ